MKKKTSFQLAAVAVLTKGSRLKAIALNILQVSFSNLSKVFGVAATACVLCFYSCDKERNIAEETKQKTINVQSSAGSCGFRVFVLEYARGNRIGGLPCRAGNGICLINNIIRLPQLVPCPVLKIPSCILVDCNNPWNFGPDVFVNPIPRFRDYFQGYQHREPNIHFVPFRVTSNIAVLQFYSEVLGTVNKQKLTLPASFNLPKEVSEDLGLIGYTVPAGSYPVVFDQRSNTLNAIVSVK
jgi:hypothetical protein